MNKDKVIIFLVCICVLSALFHSCEIKEPAAPNWDIDLNLPFTNKNYNVFNILKRSSNVGFDSLNNDLVFLFGESNYKRKFGEDLKFDGIVTTNIKAPSTLQLDTSIVIDDSTLIRREDFLNGNFSFTFFNSSNENYTVKATIKNLFKVSNNDTVRITASVVSGQQKSIDLSLVEYYVKNDFPNNTLKLRLNFQSSNPVPVNFDYKLSPYSIKTIEGRLKPLNSGIVTDDVIDPFGADVPEGEVNFATIIPNKSFLIVKKYSSLYQVDFSKISIVGENKNGHKVRLKYFRNGNAGDPIDSIFSLMLPENKDSVAYPINLSNSNILEFVNNIPKKITATRNDFLNLSYQEGMVSYTDSITIKLSIQVPLNVSITKPIIFRDTLDVGISDENQRKALDDAKKLFFNLNAVNGFPLKGTVKVLVLDSFFTTLIPITKIVGGQADSSITISAASVGTNGFVNNINTTSYIAELDSTEISKIKHMGKIIYEYKLYTDPNLIPPPLTTVKLTGRDIIRTISFGTLKYRINF